MITVDKIIIGGGIFGLYAAWFSAKNGQKVTILEYDSEILGRASFVNQARVHNGYHYPRSLSTALKSNEYFERFVEEFGFSINKKFKKIYATATNFSWVNADQFKKFCLSSGIPVDEINPETYFNNGLCDGAFETKEYSIDIQILKSFFLREIKSFPNCNIIYNSRIENIEKNQKYFKIILKTGEQIRSDFVLNATYGSINQILKSFNYETFKIKYELCEVVICKVSDNFKNTGITLMDGPFFSLMPFGKTSYHSLTSVVYTPHESSFDELPKFSCQSNRVNCSNLQLANCNFCKNKPNSSWLYMEALIKKFLSNEIKVTYQKSMYSIKTVLRESEIDDSRPTIIKKHSSFPYFYSVISGKLNTIFELEKILK